MPSTTTITPAWASLEDAAAYLGCSPKTVRRYIAAGALKAYRVAGRQTIRVKFADLDALMKPIPAGSGWGAAK